MRERKLDELLACWGQRTRLRESEAAEAFPTFVAVPGPLPVADACAAPWTGFWQCIDRMLCRVAPIGATVARRCLSAARARG